MGATATVAQFLFSWRRLGNVAIFCGTSWSAATMSSQLCGLDSTSVPVGSLCAFGRSALPRKSLIKHLTIFNVAVDSLVESKCSQLLPLL